MELLFHKDCYLPSGAQEGALSFQRGIKELVLSNHVIEHAMDPHKDRSHQYSLDKLQEALKQVIASEHEAFEIELGKNFYKYGPGWVITKVCIRVPYSDNQDACLSLRPYFNKETKKYESGKALVVTCWLNCESDSHFTLDASKYCTQQRWNELH